MGDAQIELFIKDMTNLFPEIDLTNLESDKDILTTINKQVGAINLHKDLLSALYERFCNYDNKIKLGQFLTHKEIVSFILNNIEIKKDARVLDPTCGAGAFLIGIIEKYKQDYPQADISKLVKENIYGIDLDGNMTEICRLNLLLKLGQKIDLKENILNKDSIYEGRFDGKGFSINRDFPHISKEKFDFIIGNPPFLTFRKGIDYDVRESDYFSIVAGSCNSASLMIRKSLNLLKEGGTLAFVLPKVLLRVRSYKKLRNYLLDNTKLEIIFDLGQIFKDVRGEQIILVLKKQKLSQRQLSANYVRILHLKDKSKDLSAYDEYSLAQSEFTKFGFYPTFCEKGIFELAEKFQQYTSVKDFDINIFRGVAIGANSPIVSKNNQQGYSKLLRGDSLTKYSIKYWLYLKETLQDNKVKSLQTEKLAFQNLFSLEAGMTGTLVDADVLTLDTVTNVLSDTIDLKYLLAIFNSRLASFFIGYVLFLRSFFTMHLDSSYLQHLPLLVPSKAKQEEFIQIVDKLIDIGNKKDAEFIKLNNALNQKVYELYGLSNSEVELIEKYSQKW